MVINIQNRVIVKGKLARKEAAWKAIRRAIPQAIFRAFLWLERFFDSNDSLRTILLTIVAVNHFARFWQNDCMLIEEQPYSHRRITSKTVGEASLPAGAIMQQASLSERLERFLENRDSRVFRSAQWRASVTIASVRSAPSDHNLRSHNALPIAEQWQNDFQWLCTKKRVPTKLLQNFYVTTEMIKTLQDALA